MSQVELSNDCLILDKELGMVQFVIVSLKDVHNEDGQVDHADLESNRNEARSSRL